MTGESGNLVKRPDFVPPFEDLSNAGDAIMWSLVSLDSYSDPISIFKTDVMLPKPRYIGL